MSGFMVTLRQAALHPRNAKTPELCAQSRRVPENRMGRSLDLRARTKEPLGVNLQMAALRVLLSGEPEPRFVVFGRERECPDQKLRPVLVTFWLESNEHENCAGGESSTDRDQTEPAKVVRV